MTNYPESRKANIVVQDLETEVLIYDLTINKAFCLNQTSALVYEYSDGRRTVAEISDLMSVKLKTLVSEDIVYLALNELKKNNLLENADEMPNPFGGLNRREIVKRVGLASMVMLPIIASVVAPNAAMAQSGCPGLNAPCIDLLDNSKSNCCDTSLRCYTPGVGAPTCHTCFAPLTGPQAVCSGAGCCAGRPDANKCCSNSYTETPSGPNILCFCA